MKLEGDERQILLLFYRENCEHLYGYKVFVPVRRSPKLRRNTKQINLWTISRDELISSLLLLIVSMFTFADGEHVVHY